MRTNTTTQSRPRISAGMVLSVVAIFIALAGSAFAATKLAKNTVFSKSIKNGQVKGVDVRDDSLTGADVNEATLDLDLPPAATSATPSGPAGGDLTGTYPNPDIAANAVDSANVADETLGEDDLAADSVGVQEIEADSVRGNELAVGVVIVENSTDSNGNDSKSATATCPLGKRAIGGGGANAGLGPQIVGVVESGPTSNGLGWFATGVELQATASDWSTTAYAICADVD